MTELNDFKILNTLVQELMIIFSNMFFKAAKKTLQYRPYFNPLMVKIVNYISIFLSHCHKDSFSPFHKELQYRGALK